MDSVFVRRSESATSEPLVGSIATVGRVDVSDATDWIAASDRRNYFELLGQEKAADPEWLEQSQFIALILASDQGIKCLHGASSDHGLVRVCNDITNMAPLRLAYPLQGEPRTDLISIFPRSTSSVDKYAVEIFEPRIPADDRAHTANQATALLRHLVDCARKLRIQRIVEHAAPPCNSYTAGALNLIAKNDPHRLIALINSGTLQVSTLFHAAEAAGWAPPEIAASVLIGLLGHESNIVKEGALYGLASMKAFPGVREAIERLATDTRSAMLKMIAQAVIDD